jgi:hypothetical protein
MTGSRLPEDELLLPPTLAAAAAHMVESVSRVNPFSACPAPPAASPTPTAPSLSITFWMAVTVSNKRHKSGLSRREVAAVTNRFTRLHTDILIWRK